jgi:GNAT superfamily N-acetyltransferase
LGSRHGLEIRAANAGDAPGLAALFATAGPAPDARALADRIEAFRSGSGVVLLALEWGPPSGAVALHYHPTLEADRPAARITTLFVAPDDRRRGIGRLLLKAAAQAARSAGCDGLHLDAPPDRTDLRAFCLSTGFLEAGTSLVRPLRKKA